MGFLMDGLEAEAYDRSYSDRQLVGRILGYFRPARGSMVAVAALVVGNSLLDTVLPILLSRGIDRVAAGFDRRAITILVGAILAAGVLSWLANFLRQWLTARVVGDVVLKLREDAFAAVLERDLSFYDEHSSGKIVSRVTSDTEGFANVVALTLNLLSQTLLVVLISAALFAIDARLALLTLTIAPLIVLLALGFRRLARATTRQSSRALGRVNANVQEAVSGITVAKGFRQEGALYARFREVNEQRYRVNVRSGFVFNGIFPLLTAAAGLGTTIVVYFGGLAALDGAVSPGAWFLFVQAINLFWLPLTSIASFWSQFQQGLAASERVFALIDADPRVRQITRQPVPRLAGRIEFRDVDFRYTDQQEVLRRFNLTIAAGETIALVGHTGAGKSTLGKLVTRFYEFAGGQLLIDAHDIRTFDLGEYRRQLGVVPQNPFLFAGTIADNIRYPRPEATDAEVAVVAARVGGDWLAALPEGLATPVGEGGRGLSLGQRQLVALARMLLQDPAIIILDEATASVDPLTEAEIQEGLEAALRDRTAIVIAHRLSTIERADRIIVLRVGRVVEEGDHRTLLRRGGEYADLYNTYFRHQSPDYQPGAGFVPAQTREGEGNPDQAAL
jgi:ATP-binding cassette subfamily B protein